MDTIPKNDYIPAHPPDDYKRSQADWLVELEMAGLEWGEYIPQKQWWKILETCEEE